MTKKAKKNQMGWLILLIIVCLGVIVLGGLRYVANLRGNLTDQSVQNVLTVTKQQQQAFDNFITGDRERLHSFAEFYSSNSISGPEEVQHDLMLFNDVDAIYSVMCLDDGWFCSNASDKIRQLEDEDLAYYRTLSGTGVRDSYIALFSKEPKFGYYEAFTFADGHRGLIQKSYDLSKMSATFSLSFYDNRGLAYVVNQQGDIRIRSVGMLGDHLYSNILDVLTGNDSRQEDMDALMDALGENEAGSKVFTGDMGTYVYTYVPLETVEEWFLVSVVPMDAISEETDHILLNSQMTLLLLIVVLAVVAVVIILIWRAQKEIAERDREIEYQEQLFDIFSTYLSQNTFDVYLMLDAQTRRVEYVSPNVEWVLGVPVDRVLAGAESLGVAAYPEDQQVDFAKIFAMEAGQSLDAVKTERVNPKTGEHKWFRESVYCTLVQGRRKIVVYISDRTQERNTQDTLREALRMAQAANEAKTAFLGSVSHDIRTPMNAIIGLINLLKEEPDNADQVVEYAQRIDAASQHLLGLINDVLDMNKIESGSTTLNISEVNLAEIISEINTIIRPQAKAKNQTFDITSSSLVYEHLLGDKLRINQILINLLSNAVKYTQA
ncbi:MAG: HAMP domain-containing histidine kinase, partial [Oscillospiraceae bacterium]|nr:HAMP domain-containing histidine kinase [Oscillospiraceae bacterium]